MIFSGSEVHGLMDDQEDEWIAEELLGEDAIDASENLPEECLADCLESDEISWIGSNSAAVRSYSEAQGARSGAVVELEREVQGMRESVRRLGRRMSEGAGAEVGGAGGSVGAAMGPEEVKASLEIIDKMEAILRLKAGEERRARLCRMQAEEESRGILRALPCVEVSSGVRMNLEEFMRLMGDAEGEESGGECSADVKEVGERGDEDGCKESGKEGKKTEKEEKGEMRKAKSLKFVEKNIELAKCGRGTLSLTDEEKLRIEKLLVEGEGLGGERRKQEKDSEHLRAVAVAAAPLYAIDDVTRSVLSKIDRQLEVVAKAQAPEQSHSTGSLEESEENVSNKAENSNPGRKRRNRLAEINKLLSEMNSVSHEEISPLSEEEMARLVEQSRRSLGEEGAPDEEEGAAGEGGGCPSGERSQDVICELVSNAKVLMPKFKYRFDES